MSKIGGEPFLQGVPCLAYGERRSFPRLGGR